MTCRKRKLKCDEARPICGQCLKANRPCEPSTGITFRHQHNASLNARGGGSPGQENPLNSFYNYRESFGKDTIWAVLPKGDCELLIPHVEAGQSDGVFSHISQHLESL